MASSTATAGFDWWWGFVVPAVLAVVLLVAVLGRGDLLLFDRVLSSGSVAAMLLASAWKPRVRKIAAFVAVAQAAWVSSLTIGPSSSYQGPAFLAHWMVGLLLVAPLVFVQLLAAPPRR